MPKIDDRIEALEAKLKQLKVRQQRSEARARTIASRRARHQELRRKILAGAVLLAKVESKEFDEAVCGSGWISRSHALTTGNCLDWRVRCDAKLGDERLIDTGTWQRTKSGRVRSAVFSTS
jgi:hypothetical protein